MFAKWFNWASIKWVNFKSLQRCTQSSTERHWLKRGKNIINHLWLTFSSWARLHIQASRHGWHQECHAGLDRMGLCLHDNNHLRRLEGDLMEGQRQGLGASSFPRCRCLLVGCVTSRGAHPGESLGWGVLRRGGWRGCGLWLTSSIPWVAWYNLLKVGLGLFQLGQCGIDFQRARELHVKLSCKENKESWSQILKAKSAWRGRLGGTVARTAVFSPGYPA